MNTGKQQLKRAWIFDFDGTISDIVPNRNEAVINGDCRRMLEWLNKSNDDVVAILSSRTLEDLIPRIPMTDVILAACSGSEWRLRNGEIRTPDAEVFKEAMATRSSVLPIVSAIRENIPTIDVEDKMWSITLHYRNASEDQRAVLEGHLASIQEIQGVRMFSGPQAVEIILLPRADKVNALRRILEVLEVDFDDTEITYVGDDENDAQAMKWIAERGGKAIAVGDRINVVGAQAVDGPSELANMLLRLLNSKTSKTRS